MPLTEAEKLQIIKNKLKRVLGVDRGREWLSKRNTVLGGKPIRIIKAGRIDFILDLISERETKEDDREARRRRVRDANRGASSSTSGTSATSGRGR